MWSRSPSTKPNAHPPNEEYCPVAVHNSPTGYEPNQLDNQLDNSDYSEVYAVIFQNESVDIDTEPSHWCVSPLSLASLIFQSVFGLLLPHGLRKSTSLFISTNLPYQFSHSAFSHALAEGVDCVPSLVHGRCSHLLASTLAVVMFFYDLRRRRRGSVSTK